MSRQIGIIKLLYAQKRYITIMQIAQHSAVSRKTVRNDLAVIKAHCQEYGLGVVLTKPHEGVMVRFTQEEWEKFLHMHKEEAPDAGFQSDIRCTMIRLLLKKRQLISEN